MALYLRVLHSLTLLDSVWQRNGRISHENVGNIWCLQRYCRMSFGRMRTLLVMAKWWLMD